MIFNSFAVSTNCFWTNFRFILRQFIYLIDFCNALGYDYYINATNKRTEQMKELTDEETEFLVRILEKELEEYDGHPGVQEMIEKLLKKIVGE